MKFGLEIRGAFTLLCCTFTFLLICMFFFNGQFLDDRLIKSWIIKKKKKNQEVY